MLLVVLPISKSGETLMERVCMMMEDRRRQYPMSGASSDMVPPWLSVRAHGVPY